MEHLLPQFGIRDRATLNHTINDMLLRAVEDARDAGENAAERIWNLASNLGYRPNDAAKKTETAPVDAPEVAQSDPMVDTLQAMTDQLGVIADGQKASKASTGSGGKPSKGLTLGELVSMSKGASLLEETELDKMPLKQAKRKLFGE